MLRVKMRMKDRTISSVRVASVTLLDDLFECGMVSKVLLLILSGASRFNGIIVCL